MAQFKSASGCESVDFKEKERGDYNSQPLQHNKFYLHNYENTILQKLLGAFHAFNQNVRKFGDSGKWYRNFKEKNQAGLLCTNRTRQDNCKSNHII